MQPSAFNSIARVLPKDLLSNKESEYKDVSVRAIREEQQLEPNFYDNQMSIESGSDRSVAKKGRFSQHFSIPRFHSRNYNQAAKNSAVINQKDLMQKLDHMNEDHQ